MGPLQCELFASCPVAINRMFAMFHAQFPKLGKNHIVIGVPVKKNWGGGHIFARRILKLPDGSKMNQNIV